MHLIWYDMTWHDMTRYKKKTKGRKEKIFTKTKTWKHSSWAAVHMMIWFHGSGEGWTSWASWSLQCTVSLTTCLCAPSFWRNLRLTKPHVNCFSCLFCVSFVSFVSLLTLCLFFVWFSLFFNISFYLFLFFCFFFFLPFILNHSTLSLHTHSTLTPHSLHTYSTLTPPVPWREKLQATVDQLMQIVTTFNSSNRNMRDKDVSYLYFLITWILPGLHESLELPELPESL